MNVLMHCLGDGNQSQASSYNLIFNKYLATVTCFGTEVGVGSSESVGRTEFVIFGASQVAHPNCLETFPTLLFLFFNCTNVSLFPAPLSLLSLAP